MRRVGTGGSVESYRFVENSVVGTGALVDERGVNVGRERRSDLAHGLGGAIELGFVEVAAADHGLNATGGIVDGDERSLCAGVLLEAYTGGAVRRERENPDVTDVARLQNIRELLLGPGSVGLSEGCGVASKLERGDAGAGRRNHGVNVSVGIGLVIPVEVSVFFDGQALGENVLQMSLPAMPALIGGEAVEERLVGGLLQIHIERGVNF